MLIGPAKAQKKSQNGQKSDFFSVGSILPTAPNSFDPFTHRYSFHSVSNRFLSKREPQVNLFLTCCDLHIIPRPLAIMVRKKMAGHYQRRKKECFFKFYEASKIDGGMVGPLGEDSLAASSEREPHRSLPNIITLHDKGRKV
jgi:hypothetical protein